MQKYELIKEQRLFIEEMRLPFAVCQIREKEVVPLAVSVSYLDIKTVNRHVLR